MTFLLSSRIYLDRPLYPPPSLGIWGEALEYWYNVL